MPTDVPFKDLDAVLTPQEAEQWLGIKERELRENPLVPKMRFGKKSIRYHARSVLEAMQSKPKTKR